RAASYAAVAEDSAAIDRSRNRGVGHEHGKTLCRRTGVRDTSDSRLRRAPPRRNLWLDGFRPSPSGCGMARLVDIPSTYGSTGRRFGRPHGSGSHVLLTHAGIGRPDLYPDVLASGTAVGRARGLVRLLRRVVGARGARGNVIVVVTTHHAHMGRYRPATRI